MDKKLNILFLASWYPSKVSSQAGNFIRNHAQAVAQECNVAVLHAVSRNQDQDLEIRSQQLEGVFEIVIYYKKIKGKGPFAKRKKFKAQMRAYSEGYAIARRQMGSFNLCHLNVSFPAGMFAMALKREEQLPFVITEHWTAFLEADPIPLKGITRQMVKKIGNEASAICPVSNDLAKAMQKLGIKGDYTVIPNVVDTDLFSPSHNPNTEKTRILHVSNLKNEHKNISGMLNVFKELVEENNNIELTIAGNGEINFFKEESISKGIPQESIYFLGEQSTAEVAKLMQEHHVFLLFSNYENLPCVIAEAHCTGLPVVASSVGGIPEMIDETNGALVSAGDEEKLIETLNEVIPLLQHTDRTAVAEKAAKRYSKATVAKAFMEIYNNVLNR